MSSEVAPARHPFLLVGLPWALLALATALCLLTAPRLTTPAEGWTVVAIVVALAAIQAWFVQRTLGDRPEDLTRHGGTYVVLRTVLAFVGTWLNPFFAVYALVGYFDSPKHVRGRRVWAVMGVTAVTLAGSQSGGLPPRDGLQAIAFPALVLLHVGLLTYFVRLETKEQGRQEERRRTIDALARTNGRLEDALAQNAALQAQLVVQAREAGAHDERERLALEIHDTIAQSLAGVLTQLQAASVSDDAADVRTRVERATALARSALVDARRSVQDLGPAQLDDADLAATVGELAQRWSQTAAVSVRTVVTGDVLPLHQDVATTVLRVAQEALSNVAQHADARRVDLTLTYLDDEVLLDVRDDGRGWDATTTCPVDGRGYGLPGMRRRAERVAGAVAVETEPGAGTVVSLRVPAVPR